MKQLPFIITLLLVLPLRAEELPSLWLEAGKSITCAVHSEGPWKLRSGHRILATGTARVGQPLIQTRTPAVVKMSLPPLKPGTRFQAELLLDDNPAYKVVIAAGDPFEDRKNWFAVYPISLYDPEGKIAEMFQNEEIPFDRLSNFKNIAAATGVIVIGDGIEFETERGLSGLLYQKASEGSSVFVANPKGNVPLDFVPEIVSFLLTDSVKDIFPEGSRRISDCAWVLDAQRTGLALIEKTLSHGENRFKGTRCGPTILDIRFPDPEKPLAETKGRIIVDKQFRFSSWPHDVESRYYFKSLIEKLSDKGETK